MTDRVATDGTHFRLGDAPFRVRGVTYGSFAARVDGYRFPDRATLKSDLRAMADAGLNTLRTYTLPPVELLDIAADLGLRVLVGLDYDDWRMEPGVGRAATKRIRQAGLRAVEEAMAICTGRSEVLAVAVGNEVPADLVRLHGSADVAGVLGDLVAAVHDADPEMPATYVNYPTTEYLEVPGQDLVCFNVFLEDPDAYRRYVRHLQIVATERPLLLAETGLAGEVHGEEAQAEALRWQLDVADEQGIAGVTVFSWTDEWAVNDEPVEGWGFGITDRDRRPKPALDVVGAWAQRSLVDLRPSWPRVSVVVCAYNEERTIGECLGSLVASDYPDLEVILCDDGSTDRTLEIAREFPVRVLDLPHGGLSRARNAGLVAATGEIVAYLDADAACHPEWPYHLALSMEDPVAGTGGPNLPVPDAPLAERTIATAPGQAREVLVTDDRAEHVPGCNMAFRREALTEIGGFNAAFTAAGDDVDLCWRLLDRGEQIGFAPAAQVRHHRRGSIRGYLRQQRGYGKAERMLSGSHRHRFNRLGQARWSGFIYGGARLLPTLLRPVVYHGYQGQAPYQPIAHRRAEAAAGWVGALLPLTLPVALIGLLLALWSPWWLLLSVACVALVLGYGVSAAAAATIDRQERRRFRMRLGSGWLHVAAPFARAWGRLRGHPVAPTPSEASAWWGDRAHWLGELRRALEARRCSVRAGGPDAGWDLEARIGPSWSARIHTAVVWDWEPRWRIVYRLRPVPIAVALGTLVAALWVPLVALGVLAMLAVEAIAEWVPLRRRVSDVLRSSVEEYRS